MALSNELHWRRFRGRKVLVLTSGISIASRKDASGPFRLQTYDSLVSTNNVAMALLREGDEGGVMIRAVSQTGGRGRHGRVWQSPPGNLYASLALQLDVVPAIAPQLGFVAGVALASVLRTRLHGDMRLRIKWPNDMVFDGAKLSGLLLESAALTNHRLGCVIGIGVNCRSHPDDLPYQATNLAACGDPAPEPEDLLQQVAESLAVNIDRWKFGAGFADIRASWLTLAVDAGTPLAVTLPGRRLDGIFLGLDADGRLVVETSSGREAVEAGDVFLASREA